MYKVSSENVDSIPCGNPVLKPFTHKNAGIAGFISYSSNFIQLSKIPFMLSWSHICLNFRAQSSIATEQSLIGYVEHLSQ